jgi:hypothetical protein
MRYAIIDSMVTTGVRLAKVDTTCEACAVSNIQTSPFPSTPTSRAKDVMERLHVDIAGPVKPQTFGQNRFVLVIRDDYTRYGEVFVLAHKSEASDHIIRFIEFNSARLNK